MSSSNFVNLLAKLKQTGTAVASTTTETALVRIPINAWVLADGRRVEAEIPFKYGTTGTPTMLFGVRLVARSAAATTGVLLAQSAAMTTPSGVTDALGKVEFGFQVCNDIDPAATTIMCTGHAELFAAVAPTVGSATGASARSAMASAGVTVPATVSVDCSVDKDLLVTLIWSASSGSNTAAALPNVSVRLMN